MRTAALAVLLASSAALAEPAPRVSVGAPTFTGTLDTKAFGTTIRAAQTRLGACYTKARAKAPELRGTATVTFTIAADGKAVAASATGLVQEAEACIAAVVGKLAFARPKGGKGVDVSIGITFEPGAAATDEAEAELDGGFGFGRSGFGPGGGCGTGWGTIGTGRYGTLGSGGTGSGFGPAGCGGMRGRGANVPTMRIGQPTVTGDLDKAIIRRYIKRNIQKLTYCYEKQLLVKPAIAGSIRVDFTIAGTGRVTSSEAKGDVDKNVDACFAGVIKAIEFPKPKNGGDVKVSYPFTMRPAGS